MTKRETVSIVIPAYNAENFIRDAVESCLNQTYRPMEIIVVNDGSKDATANVVENLFAHAQAREAELRLVNVNENRGAANALCTGFSAASGDYSCWLSADDMYIDKEKTRCQLDFMNRKRLCWSYFRDAYAGETLATATLPRLSTLLKMRIAYPLFSRSSEFRLMMLLFRNPVNGSSIMIRQKCMEKYGQFDPVTKNVDGDGDLWMRYSALGLKLGVLKGAPVFYRKHALQTSSRKVNMMFGCELTRVRILQTLDKTGDLLRLVKKFVPFFPVVLESRLYTERPYTSEFLLNYVLNHRKHFDRIFVLLVRRALNDVRNHENHKSLDKEEFENQLSHYLGSYTFKKFEEILSRR